MKHAISHSHSSFNMIIIQLVVFHCSFSFIWLPQMTEMKTKESLALSLILSFVSFPLHLFTKSVQSKFSIHLKFTGWGYFLFTFLLFSLLVNQKREENELYVMYYSKKKDTLGNLLGRRPNSFLHWFFIYRILLELLYQERRKHWCKQANFPFATIKYEDT